MKDFVWGPTVRLFAELGAFSLALDGLELCAVYAFFHPCTSLFVGEKHSRKKREGRHTSNLSYESVTPLICGDLPK